MAAQEPPNLLAQVRILVNPPMVLKKYEKLIHGYFPSKREVIDVFAKDRVKILYGETFDLYGITVDSLKYYLFVSLLCELHTNFEATILIADTAATINSSAGDTDILLIEGKRRLAQVKTIIETYKLPVNAVLMSELFRNSSVQTVISNVKKVIANSGEIQKLLQKTVLQNKIRQEDKQLYKYAAEAIATSLMFDVKVGPPRERFYDDAAELVSKLLHIPCYKSMYLTPTYPLGKDFTYFLLHPEIEEFGLTPYKAGSNKLQDHRIILGKTTPARIRELIDGSFIPRRKGLPDPVRDFEDIVELAKHFRKEATYGNLS
jgi:hypothetical protein